MLWGSRGEKVDSDGMCYGTEDLGLVGGGYCMVCRRHREGTPCYLTMENERKGGEEEEEKREEQCNWYPRKWVKYGI